MFKRNYLSKFKSEKGFTFLEVLVSFLILGVFLAAYIATDITINKSAEQSREELAAVQDLNQVLEDMRETAQTGTFPDNVIESYPDGGTVSGYSNLVHETITVSYANISADPLEVTATVSWTSGARNRTVSTSLKAYISQS